VRADVCVVGCGAINRLSRRAACWRNAGLMSLLLGGAQGGLARIGATIGWAVGIGCQRQDQATLEKMMAKRRRAKLWGSGRRGKDLVKGV